MFEEPPGTPKAICRTGGAAGHEGAQLQAAVGTFNLTEVFQCCFNLSKHRRHGEMTSQQDWCILVASTCLHPLIRLHNPAVVTRRQQSGWKDLAAAKLNSKLSLN